jgi:lambda family phage portal protein
MIRTRALRSARQRAIALAAAPTLLPVQGTRLNWSYPRGQYNGARTDRPNTRGWRAKAQSPDADSVGDLQTLRARARDAVRNMPLAASTLLTFQACVIGTGLQPFPMIDADFLGMTEDEGDALESTLMRHWNAWSRSRWSSFDVSANFNRQQRLQMTGRLVNGDHWVIVRRRVIPGMPYTLSLQHVEADLVSTPPDKLTNSRVIDGVELDDNGVAVAIHVSNHYPGDRAFAGAKEWVRIPIFSDDEERTRLVWHCVDRDRVSQTRGVTRFAAGIETLKGKSDFADNHLTAALNATIFTIAFKTPRGTQLLPGMVAIDPTTNRPVVEELDENGAKLPPPPPIGSGNAVSLFDDETLEGIESKHPSPNFSPFNDALITEWAASTGLPAELVLRKFTSNFSASKGAVNEGWKTIRMVRAVDIDDFCRETWRMFVTDLVALGLVSMPGFFNDPIRREAFLAHEWTGPVPGHLNPAQEATAAKTRLESFITTHEEETAAYSGRTWEPNHRQQAKEHRWQREDGLRAAVGAMPPATALGVVEPDADDEDEIDGPPPPAEDSRRPRAPDPEEDA